jgi:hypothetical protein
MEGREWCRVKKNPWTRNDTLIVIGVPLVPIAIVLLFLAGRDLGGPTPVTPERGGIVGVWTNPDGATLDFAADGTVTAVRLPGGPTGPSGSGDLPGNGRGTWQIDPWDPGVGSGGGVQIWIGNTGPELTTTGDPAHPSLFASIGDPDDGDDFTFTKQSG